MVTNVRNFLRNFATYKSKAQGGETVRVKDREGEFIFTASRPRKSLLGASKGRIAIHDDLTKPTLRNEDWQPSV